MGNKEFERSKTDKKNNDNHKIFAKRLFAKIAICAVIAGLIFTIVGCVNDQDTTENTNPGVTTPVDPSNPVEDSDDTVIDSDDPVIDPNDPVIDPDPENPGEDIPPEDVPPEDVPPEDKPPEEENPGQEDPSTEIPGSIDEVDEVDEINYFADEFTQILNETHLESLAKQFIGRNGTADDISSTEWMITNSNNNDQIKELQVKVYYDYGTTRLFKVGQVTFNQAYSVQDIIKGNATDATYSVAYRDSQVALNSIVNNTDLGKTVIQTIDPDNTLEGDIWCSIGPSGVLNGKTYREITVYQITEKGVEKYELRAEAPSADPASIIANIQEGRYTTTSQSTEYTFAGEKIEQASA